jgi:DNA-binding NarL/FixJ family response regulator
MTSVVRARGPVLVTDDDPLIRDVIVTALSDSGYITHEAALGAEALRIARRERPRVALLDVHLPDVSGYQVCRKLREEFGDAIGIVFVSGERTESFDRVAGLLLGANDYLTKPFVLDELIARVDRVEASSRPVPSAPAVERKLTRRELEVLRLLASGMGPEDVARLLVISRKTIDKHIEHILLKLGVHTRAQAVAVAFRDDLAALGIDSGDLDGAFSPNVTSIDAARRSSSLVG